MKDSITHDQSYSISKLWIFKTVEQNILINWSSSLIIYLYISSGNWYSPLISLLCSPLISIRYSSLITLRYSSLIVMSGNTHHHSTNSDRRRTTDLPEVGQLEWIVPENDHPWVTDDDVCVALISWLFVCRAPDKLRICVFYAMKTSKNACIIRSECTHYAYILLCKQTFQIRSVLVQSCT